MKSIAFATLLALGVGAAIVTRVAPAASHPAGDSAGPAAPAEPDLAALERTKMAFSPVGRDGNLKHERWPEHLPTRGARLLHALIEAVCVEWGQLFSVGLLESGRVVWMESQGR